MANMDVTRLPVELYMLVIDKAVVQRDIRGATELRLVNCT